MLSKLSLPENIFIAAFLAESHQYLSSLSNSYCFLNKKYQPIDILDEINHQTLLSSITSSIKKTDELDMEPLFNEDHIMTGDKKTWANHPLKRLYQKTFVNNGYHQSLILPVKQSDQNCGLLIFNRDRNAPAFNQESISQATLIRDALVEGLQAKNVYSNKNTSGWRSGLIIVDQRGEMTQCCHEGRNMLSLALQKKPGSLRRASFTDVRNLPGVLQIIDKLLDSTAGQVSNQVLTVNSIWGEFVINGYPVLDQGGQRAPQVYLNISWQVPFSLMLFHNIQHMNFTPRQQVIGLLYAAGESTKSIANKLEISLYTVKEHIQHIFEKLQIHTRAELIEHIICRDCETATVDRQQTNRVQPNQWNVT
jgi:DNA-binding CsgD family transcriptional regulator